MTGRLFAACLFSFAGPGQAVDFSSTITAVSDYDYRGISQTDRNPAIQASLDLGFDSGLHAGAWGSNVDLGAGEDGEVDYYLGYLNEYESGFRRDVGVMFYAYPGAGELDFPEVYIKLGRRGAGLEVWYSSDCAGTGMDSVYYRATYEWATPSEWVINFWAGYSTGEFFKRGFGAGAGAADASYKDYGVALSRGFGNVNFRVQVSGTGVDPAYSAMMDDIKVLIGVSTTLPWGGD